MIFTVGSLRNLKTNVDINLILLAWGFDLYVFGS